MLDYKMKRGPADSTRVNMGEDYEVEYWTKRFGVSKECLQKAVQNAGPLVKDVAYELKPR